jgi:HAD superfamily hydrolase (TIGR01509 family)
MTTAVLFDMDGVLVDSEPIIRAAAIRALAEFGVTARDEDFEPFVGAGENRFVGGVAELHGAKFVPEMKRRTYDWYLKLLPTMGKAFPGGKELIELLNSRGIRCAVASSADRIKVEANLTQVLRVPLDCFATIVMGEDVKRLKPYPDIYLEAARRLGVAPAACCVIEDAINGVQAAKSAGMRCVAVTTSFPAEELKAAGADVVKASISEIALQDLGII